MRIADYTPYPGQVAQGDYRYSGMGSVTPPEVLVAGEGLTRTVNQFSGNGMGFWSVDQLKVKLTQTKNELLSTGGLLGLTAGVIVGFYVGKIISGRR